MSPAARALAGRCRPLMSADFQLRQLLWISSFMSVGVTPSDARGGWRSRPGFAKHQLLCARRRDSALIKEEVKSFLANRRISQAVVAQVTGKNRA